MRPITDEDLVGKEGFEFRPLQPDVRPDDSALLKQVMDPRRGSEVIIPFEDSASVFVKPHSLRTRSLMRTSYTRSNGR